MSNKIDIPTNIDTEALILEAAEREFMAKGFAGARTTSIAEAAGVTHAMLHYYFRTKEKLFERIISEKISMLKSMFIKSIENNDMSLDDLIRNIIDRHLDFISANPDLPRFLICELFSNSERAQIFTQQVKAFAPVFLSALQDKIDSMASLGKCRRVDAKILMLDIVSLNVFPYMSAPIVNAALDNCLENRAEFLQRRKKENYHTIMLKLKP